MTQQKIIHEIFDPTERWTDFNTEEMDYILLLTSLDAMRIRSMEKGAGQDDHYRIRHSVQEKIIGRRTGKQKGFR